MGDLRAVRSLRVEFSRFESDGSAIARGKRYIRTSGAEAPAREVAMPLGHRDFLLLLRRLRYGGGEGDARPALEQLSALCDELLRELPCAPGPGLVQLDLVANAAELWAVPFEAWCPGGAPAFASPERPFVLTRRVRGDFPADPAAWPAVPRVLFAHAAIADDLPRTLVDAHAAALARALAPWGRGKAADERLLAVKEVCSVADLRAARAAGGFTHVHVLAHGQAIANPELPEEIWWGLRLGLPGGEAAHPAEIAEALRPDAAGLPAVVTLAACDAGNQADPTLPTYSLVQELHRRGVPVVLGSQLPLTFAGSVLLAERFYAPLLAGEDARVALRDVRVALHAAREARRDWVGLVGYVRLPEGYADHLAEVGLRVELALLEAAQARAEPLRGGGAAAGAEHAELEGALCARIASLEGRLEALRGDRRGLRQECQGLLASAHKRRAELLFALAGAEPAAAGAGARRAESRRALEAARAHYRAAFRSDVELHWQGIQQLALDAALDGAVRPLDWLAVTYAASTKAEDDAAEFWALGTLAEAHLLAPVAGRPRALAEARDALARLAARVPPAERSALVRTRRHLARYVGWWTRANGFFPGREDLSRDAQELVALLDR